MTTEAACEGSWALGNNCGGCRRCAGAMRDGVAEIRRLRGELAAAQARPGQPPATAQPPGEAGRLARALLRIFHRCEHWSPADVRAAVADALGLTVAELDGGRGR